MPWRTALVVTLLSFSSSFAEPPAGWHRYSAPDGSFMVSFPRLPVEVSSPEEGGPVHVVKTSLGGPKEAASFLIISRDISKKLPAPEDAKNYLLGRQLGVIEGAKGRLLEEHDITLQGKPGREFLFQTPRVGLVHCRIYLSGRTMVHLSHFSMSNDRKSLAEGEPFFASFSLGE